jgi:hypothetical protein
MRSDYNPQASCRAELSRSLLRSELLSQQLAGLARDAKSRTENMSLG